MCLPSENESSPSQDTPLHAKPNQFDSPDLFSDMSLTDYENQPRVKRKRTKRSVNGREKKQLKLDTAVFPDTSVGSHENKTLVSEEDSEKEIDYEIKKKCVLLVGYSGKDYRGMQRNPGVRTIEKDLVHALAKARAISQDASKNFRKHMVPDERVIQKINEHLEPQIRVFALKQVTRIFNCESGCSSKTYKYLLPTFAFAPTYARTTIDFRITGKILEELNFLLKSYEGKKNFHNFTSGKKFKDGNGKVCIIEFNVDGEPFVQNNTEFLVLKVNGTTFLRHQIRNMIGLVIAIIKKLTKSNAILRAFQEPKMDIPKAPSLGLILDQVYFNNYNKKFGCDGQHEPLEWSAYEDKIEEFQKKYIYSDIITRETTTNSMMKWLKTLSKHTKNRRTLKKEIKQPREDSS